MKITGIKELRKRLTAMGQRKRRVQVNVGYTQHYAVHVHENLDSFHAVGMAKYLETPARDLKVHLGWMVAEVYKKTKNIELALVTAGLFLQRTSQQAVPVDTGALKASAFTRVEKSSG